MNKVYRTLVVAALLFVCTSMIAYADAYQEGDMGEDITAIQKQLVTLGYNVANADGSFGPITVGAIKAFQKDRGLEVDGIVGNETYGC